MSAHTQYGFCLGCKRWVPRDEMLAINTSVYDAKNKEMRIRMRFCPSCHIKKVKELVPYRWKNELKMESELTRDPELASQANVKFDDSEQAMREAGLLRDSMPPS